jgi:hypothetical protein
MFGSTVKGNIEKIFFIIKRVAIFSLTVEGSPGMPMRCGALRF